MIAWAMLALAVEFDDAALQRWDKEVAATTWAPPSEIRRNRLAQAMAKLPSALESCDAVSVAELSELFELAGWDVELWQQPRSLVFTEIQGTGGGMSVWRCGSTNDVVIQAPHGLYDLGTAEIAIRAFHATNARAVMLNTVHRYRAQPGETMGDRIHPADVAHRPTSLFHTWTVVWAWSVPAARVVQVHGFADKSAEAEIIVSSGRSSMPPLGATEALKPFGRVQTWGVDAQTLGATKNVQLDALNKDKIRAIHVELSRTARKTIGVDAVTAVVEADWLPSS